MNSPYDLSAYKGFRALACYEEKKLMKASAKHARAITLGYDSMHDETLTRNEFAKKLEQRAAELNK